MSFLRITPACRRGNPLSSGCFRRPILVVLVTLITFTGACERPPIFRSMKVKGSINSSYSVGDVVEYECRMGYKKDPSASMSTVCQADNTWSPIQEGCKKKSCAHPGEIADGHFTALDGNFEFGSRVKYVCDEGFNLIGSDTLTCELTGQSLAWNDNPPICDKARCAAPPNIENGKYSNQKEVYEYNEIVRYSCNPASGPDEFSLIGNDVLVCSLNAQWSGEPPKCKVVKCPFPVVSNGNQLMGIGTKHYYKAVVTFECMAGFVMKGNSTAVCEEDSLWVPPLPQCVRVPIPPSTQPPSSAQPPTSTQPTFSSHSGTAPGSTTTSPGIAPGSKTTSPGQSSSTHQPPVSNALDGGIIAVIVIAALIAVIVACIFLYRCQRKRKTGKGDVTAEYTTCKNTSVTPAEQEGGMVPTN